LINGWVRPICDSGQLVAAQHGDELLLVGNQLHRSISLTFDQHLAGELGQSCRQTDSDNNDSAGHLRRSVL